MQGSDFFSLQFGQKMVAKSLEMNIHHSVGDNEKIGHCGQGAKVQRHYIERFLIEQQPGDFFGEYLRIAYRFSPVFLLKIDIS